MSLAIRPTEWASSTISFLAASIRHPVAVCAFLISFSFIALHCLELLGERPDPKWRIDREGSWPELFEFNLLLFSSALLVYQAVVSRRSMYCLLGIMVLYLSLDGFFEIHENASVVAGKQHWGELIYMTGVGLLFLVLMAHYLYRASTSEVPQLLSSLFAMGILGGAAVGLDAIHVLVGRTLPSLDQLVATLEDGLELLAITLLFAVTLTGSLHQTDKSGVERSYRERRKS